MNITKYPKQQPPVQLPPDLVEQFREYVAEQRSIVDKEVREFQRTMEEAKEQFEYQQMLWGKVYGFFMLIALITVVPVALYLAVVRDWF